MNTVEYVNGIGAWFVDYGLSMLLQSSILIILLLIADRVMKQRVRAVVRYGLWLLVLVKLVLPVGVAAPCSPFYWLPGQSQGITAPVVTDMPASEFVSAPRLIQDNPPAKLSSIEPVDIQPSHTPSTISQTKPEITPSPAIVDQPVIPAHAGQELSWQALVFLAWSIVVLILFAMLLQRYWFVRSLIAQALPSDDHCYEILLKAKARLNISRSVRLGFSGSSMSPSVCGLTSPVILIPADMADKLSDSQLEAILLHELAHVRRGDLWVNLLQTLLQILYFWHPLLWLANDRIRAIREQAVDEQVLVTMGEQADAYPETLVHVSKLAWSRPMLSLRLIGVVESKSALAARIRHILSRPIPGTAKIGRKGILAIILAAAIILPMAQGATSNPEFIIKGKVVDAVTGEPIPNVRVGDIENYNKGIFSALTDDKGQYTYKTWYEEHSIQAKAIGYKTADDILITKVLGSETEKVIDFKLVLDLPEIELSTHKYVKAGSVVSFVLKHKGGSIESTEIKSSVCPNIVIVLDGQKCQTNMGSSPYSDGSFVTLTNNSFVAGEKRELSMGKHTVQAEYEPHTFTINGKTVEVSELKSNIVEFEVVDTLPDGYLQPKHYENAKQILDECSVKVFFGFHDKTDNPESYWYVKGYAPSFNIAAKAYLESESGKKIFIKDLLVPGNEGPVVKNKSFDHQYGDGSDKNLEIITDNRFVIEKWRVVLDPSQDVAMTDPAIRSYCNDIYYGPYEKIQIPLDGSWFYGSGIDTRSEFGLANIELMKSEYIDLDKIQYLKQPTDAELRYDKQSSSLVPVSDNGVWAVKLTQTYSLKNLVEQVKQALKDGNAGKNIVNAIPAGDDLFDMYVVRTDKGANYILVVNTVKDNQQGMMSNNELFLLTISDEIINEAKDADEDAKAYTVDFAGGVSARVVGVSVINGLENRWWSPAGSRYEKWPYEISYPGVQIMAGANEVAIWLEGLKKDDKVIMDTPSASVSNSVYTSVFGLAGNKTTELKSFIVGMPEGKDTGEVRIGLSSDNWETVADCGPAGGNGIHGVEQVGALMVCYANIPQGADSFEYRLVGVDTQGEIHLANWMFGLKESLCGQFDIAKEKIAGYKLQKRNYVWQTVSNVRFKPDEAQGVKKFVEPKLSQEQQNAIAGLDGVLVLELLGARNAGEGAAWGQAGGRTLSYYEPRSTQPELPAGRFIAKRDDGLELELVGVVNCGDDINWWQADGSNLKIYNGDKVTKQHTKKEIVLRAGNSRNIKLKELEISAVKLLTSGNDADSSLAQVTKYNNQGYGNYASYLLADIKDVKTADLEVTVKYATEDKANSSEVFVFRNISLVPGEMTKVEFGVKSETVVKADETVSGKADIDNLNFDDPNILLEQVSGMTEGQRGEVLDKLFEIASKYVEQRKFQEAIDVIDQILKIDPKNETAKYLSNSYEKFLLWQKQHKEAREANYIFGPQMVSPTEMLEIKGELQPKDKPGMERSGDESVVEVPAMSEDVVFNVAGRKVAVPEWPKIELATGVYAGFGSFSARVWDDKVGSQLSGAWDDLKLNGQQLIVPDGHALKLDIGSSNNTDLSVLAEFGSDDIQVLALPSVNKIDSRAMPNIGKLTGLVALYLGGANIRDKDLAYLTNLKELKCLSLQGCAISDDSIETLTKMASLRELNLWGTAVTQNGYKQLLKKLPNCSVWWDESERKDNRLIGKWNSEKFSGLCAGDFVYEAYVFNKDGSYQQQVIYTGDEDGCASLDGKYRIEKDKIVFDDGQSVPYEFDGDKLVVSRRANIGKVKVTFASVARDSGIKLTAMPHKQSWDIAKEIPVIDVQVSIEDEVKYKANRLDEMKFAHWLLAFVMYVDGVKYYPCNVPGTYKSEDLSEPWNLEIKLDGNYWKQPINAGEYLGPDNNKDLIWSPGNHKVKLVFIGKDMNAGRKWFTTNPAGILPPEVEFEIEIGGH